LPAFQLALWIAFRIVLNASQNGKGLALLSFNLVLVFLSMSMGFDLDCYVPFSPPSPKKFTVFRGSGNLKWLGKRRDMVKSEMVLLDGYASTNLKFLVVAV
jgi:hypothetical protein